MKLQLDGEGEVVGDPELLVEFENKLHSAEGLTVDVCGNVYVSLATDVVRISSDGKEVEPVWTGR